MHTDTGRIEHLKEEDLLELIENGIGGKRYSTEKKMVELSEEESKKFKTMGLNQRKNTMRNKPCVCGSGKKFKKCCWSNFK